MRRLVLAFVLAFSTAWAQDEPRPTGPQMLVMQYRFPPGKRPDVRQRMLAGGLQNFDRWQADGILSGHRIFISRYVDFNGWDMMAVLQFRQYNDVARWRRVEATAPAGLAPEVLALATTVETYPVDTLRYGASEDRPIHPVHFVTAYTLSASPDQYVQYFDAYLKPQFEGWMREGVLSSYQLMMQRYPAARPWDVLILLTYKDEENFGLRESVAAKVRGQLQDNAGWNTAGANGRRISVEKQGIICDELAIQ